MGMPNQEDGEGRTYAFATICGRCEHGGYVIRTTSGLSIYGLNVALVADNTYGHRQEV
jgi:hypothetical protein